jgi:glycosyltransferase involved in cell wall biosynthesis
MRVAVLGQYPLDEGRILGGVEGVMVPLLHSLASLSDLEMHMVTCQGVAKDYLTRTQWGVPLHVRKRRRFGRLTFYARDVLSIRRALRAISPDVVHAHGSGIYVISALGFPCNHVVTVHGIIYREVQFGQNFLSPLRALLDSFYERYSLARVQNLISINPYVEQEVARIGGFRGHLYPIENPVDGILFSVSGAGEKSTILYAGAVIPRKRLMHLLRALAQARKTAPQVELRVAGEVDSAPEYVEACRRFIAEHGLETTVTFLGSLAIKEMVMEYARCAVLALPSKQESAPMAVAEAMAAGRPVVATRLCGMVYMVEHGGSGLLVDDDDVSELADALLRLLGDDQLRARMGQRGRELAQARFRASVVAQQTRDVYLKILNEPSPCSGREAQPGGARL